jgi:valyl-tRNA synthetase
LKLIKSFELRVASGGQNAHSSQLIAQSFPVQWFENRLNETTIEIEKLYEQFRLSEALKTIYSLIWDDFCSWYLEWIKPGFEQPIEKEVYEKTVGFFETLMQLLHPFMPFATEEVFHLLKEQEADLCIRQLENIQQPDPEILAEGSLLKNIITNIRDARNKNTIKPKEAVALFIQTENENAYKAFETILSKQVNATEIAFTKENVPGSIVLTNEKDKLYIKTEQHADASALRSDLEKDLAYQKNFLLSVQKKLSNERFVQNAKPEVVELERKKQADAEARIKTIEESLQHLV